MQQLEGQTLLRQQGFRHGVALVSKIIGKYRRHVQGRPLFVIHQPGPAAQLAGSFLQKCPVGRVGRIHAKGNSGPDWLAFRGERLERIKYPESPEMRRQYGTGGCPGRVGRQCLRHMPGQCAGHLVNGIVTHGQQQPVGIGTHIRPAIRPIGIEGLGQAAGGRRRAIEHLYHRQSFGLQSLAQVTRHPARSDQNDFR